MSEYPEHEEPYAPSPETYGIIPVDNGPEAGEAYEHSNQVVEIIEATGEIIRHVFGHG